jgi:hypothetical protein
LSNGDRVRRWRALHPLKARRQTREAQRRYKAKQKQSGPALALGKGHFAIGPPAPLSIPKARGVTEEERVWTALSQVWAGLRDQLADIEEYETESGEK